MHHYDQRNYEAAQLHCNEAIELWRMVKQSNIGSFPDWAVDSNIETCQNILYNNSRSKMAADMTIVPIMVKQNRILVDVLLNDKYSATLLLDTGATHSLLTPEMADILGIRPSDDAEKITVYLLGRNKVKMPVVNLSAITIGDATVKNLSVGVFALGKARQQSDGILGEDFLSHYSVIIDHKEKQLKLFGK